MLAFLYSLEKFHYYGYGWPVVIESNHKPLLVIFKKFLASAPPCIAMMMLRIKKYDAQIKYVPGMDIPIADTLSRISSCHNEAVQGVDVSVHKICQNLRKKQYDKTARQPLCPLFPEDRVRILNPSSNIWESGVVQCVADTQHTYLVATEKGGVL